MSANSVGREVDKAQGYINALDNARSEDKWSDVPELIRKVSKHAPHRKCTGLVQTAHAEAQVVAHITKSRPGTAKGQTTPNQVSNLSELIPELIAAIEAAEGTPQDVFQAQVCLGWVHWTLSEPGLAVVRLPKDLDDSTVASLSEGGKGLTKWTEVCIVKAGYIKSAAQASISGHDTALESASPVLTRLTIPNPALSSCHQALLWSEIFLSKIAMLPSQDLLSNTVGNEDFKIETALKAFRLWSGHPYTKSRDVAASQKTLHDRDVISKSSIWMTYYKVLSSILQYGLPYFPPSTGSSRRQLATELRQVEAICESILLRETKFPLARGSNPQVETWTEDVISNWQVLCGPAWDDEDLGDGGQDAVSRNVLDILYRAATKTYHSHSILRHLFHVHAALAEFDLAMKALDTYVEIVVSAKDRAEKAAEIGHLESDETLLQTVSEGVLLLCCFGSEEEARKAKELVAILEKYIEKDIVDNLDMAAANGDIVARVSPRIMALSYKAIGIGLGTWSRWTPESEARNDIRAEAIENLERSIAPELESEDDTGARYALALLLAESRDLDGAIGQVKTALARKNESPVSETEVHEPYQPEECDKIALWHLLALLLSAKQEFELAGRTCEAAFDQLPHLMTRPGPDNRRSVRENNGKQDLVDRKTAYIQQLQGREKERIIETRMTQLALLEVTDGPEVAVNHSDNLLALFATLFEDLELEVTKDKASQSKQQQTLEPPKSSAGTIKSFRGSIFGRKKGSKIPDRSRNGKDTYPPLPNGTSLGTEAPMIKVTSENANKTPQSAHTDGHHNQRMEASNDADALENEKNEIGPDAIGIAVSDHKLTSTSPSNPKESAKQTLPAVAHNMNHKTEPHPAGHANQPPEQDVRLPTPRRFTSPTKALTKFPTIQAQKHAISVLVKVWLMIAGMYRRASLFDDALEACEEAAKQAASFDALVAAEESSARAFEGPVWGIAKSSEQLWADVHAERGALPEAQSQAYEATQYYEEAIACFPDHPKATIALSNLLLDAWEKNVSLEPVETPIDSDVLDSHVGELLARNSDSETSLDIKKQDNTKEFPGKDEPEFLSRLAARDRAYGLISMLTKTGAAWDNSDAWFTLSRAYEAGSQIEKAKDILWWCVELEDRRPIRHWWNIGAGGYVL